MIAGLSALVTGVAVKRLTDVEINPDKSHQGELNGVQELRELFGDDRLRCDATFLYLSDAEEKTVRATGTVTWYDAREQHPTRSEYRLYFTPSGASAAARAGDAAFVLRLTSGDVIVVFVDEGSTAERQMTWLFDTDAPAQRLTVKRLAEGDVEVGFAAREVLTVIGVEVPLPEDADSDLDQILDLFGEQFPSTREFSQFARDLTEGDDTGQPDEAVMAWLEREEALFRQLERHLVLKRLRVGFGEDVDGFIAFSLSVQNRRKSRVGQALENHLQALFELQSIRFSRGQITERTSKPDFVFPHIGCYRDQTFPADRLTMLGVKSTCKDRWRQVLAEADRIQAKHLFTLEPAISTAQTDEMLARSVTLVMPVSLHASFLESQRQQLISVKDFIHVVAEKQG